MTANLPIPVVLDTNAVLDLFLFRDARLVPLHQAVVQGRLICLTDPGCLTELARVLDYPKLQAWAHRFDAQNAYTALARLVPGEGSPVALPHCRDGDDQRFLELAARGQAAWLISKDKLVLKVRRSAIPLPFEVLHPEEALGRLNTPPSS